MGLAASWRLLNAAGRFNSSEEAAWKQYAVTQWKLSTFPSYRLGGVPPAERNTLPPTGHVLGFFLALCSP